MNQHDSKTPPVSTPFGILKMPVCEKINLDNEIELNIIRTGTSPVNRISLTWNYGTADGGGLYYPMMVAPMMMQGTAKMSAVEIVDQIDFLGAFVNNRTYSTFTGIDAVSLNEFTPKLLDILAEVLTEPVLPIDRFEAMRRQALAKLKVDQNHPRFLAHEKLTQLLAGSEHPYIVPTTEQTLTDFTINDIRQAWKDGVGRSSIFITASGYIDDELVNHIHNFAHRLRPTAVELRSTHTAPYNPVPPCSITLHHPETQQASIAICIPTINRSHPDYIPLRIAVTALGGYFGSRLMTNIREKMGLTYGISACLAAAHEGAAIKISAECNLDAADRVIDQINAEITRLASLPMEDEELNRLKSYYMTTIADTVESFITVGEYYENQRLIGIGGDYFEQQQNFIKNITAQTIMQITKRYMSIADQRIVMVK